MTGVMTLYRSSIGKKVIMALTGFVLVGFVVFHMYGNTKLYYGPEVFNHYAAGLRTIGEPIFAYEHLLWVARLVLLASVVLHIWAATSLTMQSHQGMAANRVSTTARYGKTKTQQATYASRTMRWGGIIIFLFILYHLLHLTFGAVGYAPGQYLHPESGEYQVYHNVIYGFRNPIVSGVYLISMVAICLHLYHGVWSMFQTLGVNSYRTTKAFRALAIVIALVVFIGNISFPIAVMLRLVGAELPAA